MPRDLAPPASPHVVAELLSTLTPAMQGTLATDPCFICLQRELTELQAALDASDLLERTTIASHRTLLQRQIAARENRAFRRVRAVTTAILRAPVASQLELVPLPLVVIAAGQPGPPETSTFPWRELRTSLTQLAQLRCL